MQRFGAIAKLGIIVSMQEFTVEDLRIEKPVICRQDQIVNPGDHTTQCDRYPASGYVDIAV